ncbi:DEAD/DEAH box helicase [Venatoribacter cucullus]|uniref:DEAD/DEAH box helicase n=1 Tax=Venatoribacter cucullus TaxID=2661630 RepID=A0A9X7V409_9GAMM|nr:DEAD/DEAH box helicase [Venatoribacter cucullus]QQD25249.1 DEAD/DEAH box helicase [Venatoribacter cucullus]
MTFASLGLHEPLLATLHALNYQQPTAVQQAAIPAILAGRDVLAGAQTGTGKTAAFLLPKLQQLLNQPAASAGQPLLLVVAPTRELAQQVADSAQRYGAGSRLRTGVAYGGVSLRPQIQALQEGLEILIATPGRLLDLINQQALTLSAVQTLVLDEADRMLDLGFSDEIRALLKLLPAQRQTLFFSATFPKAVKDLAYSLLRDPQLIEVTPENSTVDSIKQTLYQLDKKRKAAALAYLIGAGNWQQVLVFVRTKQGADALVKELALDGIKADSLHGDKSQGARQRALDDFKAGAIRALIATDVAARGIDIVSLPHVVNYELPFNAEDYVHRIGRTGRAGNDGHAISLVSRDEENLLAGIEQLIKRPLPMIWLTGFEPAFDEDLSRNGNPRKARAKAKAKAKAQAVYGIRKTKKQ